MLRSRARLLHVVPVVTAHGSDREYSNNSCSSTVHDVACVRASLRRRGGGDGSSSLLVSALATSSLSRGALVEQRRYSLKYTRKPQHNEMRQPDYIHDKRHGLFEYECYARRRNVSYKHVPRQYRVHMNLWETDTDASNNRFFRNYLGMQREVHTLLGRPHAFEAADITGRQGDTAYELQTDMRYKGAARPAITNLHYEPAWNTTLYRCGAHGSELNKPGSALVAAVLGPELLRVRDVKSVEHCRAWYERLLYLVKLHYDAVGDIGPYTSRHTQHVHAFFVAFHDALSSFDFQDSYLCAHLHEVCPHELRDVFGVFLEMEANYVNEDYCPRCSLPYATTRFCGEGDTNTPFRVHRGRWAPHQQWGKEWYDVVARRAEALWRRATEDPYFGTATHTQRQAEALLRVYVKTRQRAKAIDFVHELRGSREGLLGQVVLTPAMQAELDTLLDTTPHPHMLTNAFTLDSRAAVYTGDAHAVPHSPLQLRIDLELAKLRRQQREEGVVRVPPAGWQIDTHAVVPYKLDAQRRVCNWREVKTGIERSFLSTGLPRSAYRSEELREMAFLRRHMSTRAARRAALEAERQRDEAAAQAKMTATAATAATASSADYRYVVFPDRHWWRVFDATPSMLQRDYGVAGGSGALFYAVARVFADPAAVPYTDAVHKTALVLDTTAAACRVYGDYVSGDVLRIRVSDASAVASASKDSNSSSTGSEAATMLLPPHGVHEVVVAGVDVHVAQSARALYAMYTDPALHAQYGLLRLGVDCDEIVARFAPETLPEREGAVPLTALDAARTAKEEVLGQVVGVRHGVLYVQWQLLPGGGGAGPLDRGVAVPVGTPAMVHSYYTLRKDAPLLITNNSSNSNNTSSVPTTHAVDGHGKTAATAAAAVVVQPPPLTEPPSWHTPFRNDAAEERLRELETAPLSRESWASLIKGKYTPKKARYGYAQHNTNDDFATKEYTDRLLARQYFHNAQAFEVLPERRERAASFAGRWAYQRTCGVPTVDRNELERGWAVSDVMSDAEMNAVEQALRDISGRRPGNYYKRPQEVAGLQLNESWWRSVGMGWQQHNREQAALHNETERALVDPTRLMFGGTLPPFATSYGIAERVRGVVADYSRGFGLHTAHGHSPHADSAATSASSALAAVVAQRERGLGFGNALVRLFDEKLAGQDEHTWALEQSVQHGCDVRHVLLSLHEWRERGRAPSLLLSRLLASYLREEVAAYNDGVPAGVPRLEVLPSTTSSVNSSSDGSSSSSGGGTASNSRAQATMSSPVRDGGGCTSTATHEGVLSNGHGSVWYDVDKLEYAYDYAKKYSNKSSEDEPYIVTLVRNAQLATQSGGGGGGGSGGADVLAQQYAQQAVVNMLQMELIRIVGKGIPPAVIAQRSAQLQRGYARHSGLVATYVRASELTQLLRRLRVTAEDVAAVTRGLANCPEQEPMSDGDFIVPVSLLLSWTGPHSGSNSSSSSSSNGGGGGNSSDAGGRRARERGGRATSGSGGGGSSNALTQLLHGASAARRGGGVGDADKMVVHVLDELAVCDDGLAMDIAYTIRENKHNAVLQREFASAFLPVFAHDEARVAQLYDEYCEGKYVPNVTVAIDAFVAFLARVTGATTTAATSPTATAATVVPYFELDTTSRHAGQYTQLQLLPPEVGPFHYDNTLIETMATTRLFRTYGILAGPTRVPASGLIAAASRSLCYFAHRKDEVVYVTVEHDHGLAAALARSPHYAHIRNHKELRLLLSSPSGAGLVATFNRYLYRVAPMLSFFQGILAHYNNQRSSSSVHARRQSADHANRTLARVLDAEASVTIEQNFRRNAERYWRNLLEGRSVEEMSLLHAPASSSSSSSSGPGGSSGRGVRASHATAAAASRTQPTSSSRSDDKDDEGSSAGASSGDGGAATAAGDSRAHEQPRSRGGGATRAAAVAATASRSMNELLQKLKSATDNKSSGSNSGGGGGKGSSSGSRGGSRSSSNTTRNATGARRGAGGSNSSTRTTSSGSASPSRKQS